MTQDICIDPSLRFFDYSEQVCRSPAPAVAPGSESAPPFAQAPRPLTTIDPRGPAIFRASAEFRRSLIRDAFGDSRPQARATFGDPVASSLWSLASLLPVACNSHPPLQGDSDSGGGSDSGQGGSDGGSPATAPNFTRFSRQALAPCGSQGMITDLDEGLGVCANYVNNEHHLFTWNAASPGAESLIPLTYAPDQVLRGSDGAIYVSTHQSPGLAVVRPTPGEESHFGFPTSLSLSGASSSGRSLASLRPAYPKGLAQIGNEIFIATSNYDEVHGDFQPGTVLAFDTLSQTYSHLPTSAFNPTGLAEANGRLLVVNSGAIDRNGHVSSDGSLDVFNPHTFELEASLPLGRRGAGLNGEIALSADGSRAVLPTADNSGRLIVVDWQSSQVREIDLRAAGIGGSRIFFSSLQVSADGNFAVVSNFNDGRVYSVNLEQGTISGASLRVDSRTDDTNGLSDGLRLGAEYFVGFGPEVLRLQP